ncbi:ATP-binding protein [Firmicutes bacterium AM59-13]|jgi:predicted AAA+ superfamily ATPase|nr:ATP-binding protein [Firmicutes bacterium AM59-13]
MLERRIKQEIRDFLDSDRKEALMVTGARQVGKTYIIRECAKEIYKNIVEINFVENQQAVKLFENITGSKDILLRLSALTDVPMIPGETLVFFDEVQECPEIVTAIKFLVEDGQYRYILSGSLLGVELKDIRSVPVGYLSILEMYPLDFREFCEANRVSQTVMDKLKECFEKKQPVDELIHEKMMELFRLYLIVGGMPAVVDAYIRTNNLKEVLRIQQGIVQLYYKDIAKYDKDNKLYLDEIFSLIPSELNNKNKRFIMKDLNENFRFSRYENSFIWLKEAGVALPVYCVQEPEIPLLLSKSTNLFKLFLSDVGLLASMYVDGLQLKILSREKDINFGAIYENVAVQELKAHGFELYYFNSKKQGELDFVIEYQGNVLPLEIKSGKAYTRHNALDNVLKDERYAVPQALVFCNENISTVDKIVYLPIYMIGFLENEKIDEYIYSIDLSALQ